MSPRELAAALADRPRWIDTRGALLSGRCRVLPEGVSSDYLVVSTDFPFVGVVGGPDARTIKRAAELAGPAVELLVQTESVEHVSRLLPGWHAEAVLAHLRAEAVPWPPPSSEPALRFLGPAEGLKLGGVPPPLREELRAALESSPIAAWFEGGEPVSFCYAAVVTESLWDVSVDTLEPWRGRGLAGRCFLAMNARMVGLGKRPVWAAHESNTASLRAAAKLGFERAETFWAFRPI